MDAHLTSVRPAVVTFKMVGGVRTAGSVARNVSSV